eukprot:3158040-Rhodomonas_salina.1
MGRQTHRRDRCMQPDPSCPVTEILISSPPFHLLPDVPNQADAAELGRAAPPQTSSLPHLQSRFLAANTR